MNNDKPRWFAFDCPTCGAKAGEACSHDLGEASCMARVLLCRPAASDPSLSVQPEREKEQTCDWVVPGDTHSSVCPMYMESQDPVQGLRSQPESKSSIVEDQEAYASAEVKLNQYGFTGEEWHKVVEQGCALHDALMAAEGDWDQESHVIMECLIAWKKELLAAHKEIAELKKQFQDYKDLITKCLGAGIVFQGDDEPLINERAEKAEAELHSREARIVVLEADIVRANAERDELLYHTRHASPNDVAWHSPRTVGHLRRQLETLDPNMAIGCSYFVKLSNGEIIAKTTGVSMSYERVNNERNRIESGNKEIPRGIIIWAHSTDAEGKEEFALQKGESDG